MARPSIIERAAESICPECGKPAVRKSNRGPKPTFCSRECKISHQNRGVVEGRAAIAFLKAWRIDRGNGEIAKASLEQLCRMVDEFNARDRAEGRPRADLYAAKMLATGTYYFDRSQSR